MKAPPRLAATLIGSGSYPEWPYHAHWVEVRIGCVPHRMAANPLFEDGFIGVERCAVAGTSRVAGDMTTTYFPSQSHGRLGVCPDLVVLPSMRYI